QLTLDQPVDEPALEPFPRTDRVAGGAHLERFPDARDARQALGPARARQKPKLDLGRAELRAWVGDPIMAAERDFEPAAERGAVDRRDHRLRTIFDRVDDFRKPRHLRRLAEF